METVSWKYTLNCSVKKPQECVLFGTSNWTVFIQVKMIIQYMIESDHIRLHQPKQQRGSGKCSVLFSALIEQISVSNCIL